MKKLVGGNWKMNCNLGTFGNFEGIDARAFDAVDSFLAVPHVYIPLCKDLFPKNILVCAQDISEFESGAYTGEVSAAMLADFGVRYAIIGHSERRVHCNETHEQVLRKLANALKYSITPILCIGEPSEVRGSNKHLEFLEEQFNRCTGSLAGVEMDVAYEPIWAIGSSRAASKEQISEVIQKIKALMKHRRIKGRVIYGGSVCKESAIEIAKIEHLDGVLVGNASLGQEFVDIAWAFAKTSDSS